MLAFLSRPNARLSASFALTALICLSSHCPTLAAPPTPAVATLQGHVELAGPIKGWRVAAQDQPTATLAEWHRELNIATLATDGKFTLPAAPGAQYICLYYGGKLDADSVQWLAPGEAHQDILLKPKAPRSRLETHLLNTDGKPLGRKVRVRLFNEVGEVTVTPNGTSTDISGVAVFDSLPVGSYRLWLDSLPPAKRLTIINPSHQIFDLTVTSGTDTQSLNLTVPAVGATQGILQLPDGKTPAQGYTVAVQSGTQPLSGQRATPADYARGAHEAYVQTQVQADGSFTLPGLPKGVHQLDIRRPGETAPWSTILAAPVTPGETLSIGSWNVPPTGWQMMCDGQTLAGWKPTDFAGHSPVRVQNGTIILPMGNDMTGITWTKDIPHTDYEVSLEAMRQEGHDFFCGLTFPVAAAPCSLILGGWGGSVVGLSSINGLDASENETTKTKDFDSNRWYRIRLRVTKDKIQAWIDEEQFVDLDLADKKLSIRLEVEESQPFGIATWRTTGAIRDIRIRRIDAATEPAK